MKSRLDIVVWACAQRQFRSTRAKQSFANACVPKPERGNAFADGDFPVLPVSPWLEPIQIGAIGAICGCELGVFNG